MVESRHLYSVYPKKPIKGLLKNGRPINSPKTLSLTKDEALFCMKFGTVYRRFGEENRNERVTTLNIDRLHNTNFITEEEWKPIKELKDAAEEAVSSALSKINEEKKEEIESAPVVEPEAPVDTKEEITEVDLKESQNNVADVVEETEKTTEEVTEEEETSEEESEDNEEESEEDNDDRGTVINTEAGSDRNYYTAQNRHGKKKRH